MAQNTLTAEDIQKSIEILKTGKPLFDSYRFDEHIMKAMRSKGLLDPGHSHGAMSGGGAGGGASSSNAAGSATTQAPDRWTPTAMARMVASRMGWGMTPGAISPFPFREFHCAKLNDTEAVVWLIHKDVPLTIHDDLNLFPSDALVTSLRLLLG